MKHLFLLFFLPLNIVFYSTLFSIPNEHIELYNEERDWPSVLSITQENAATLFPEAIDTNKIGQETEFMHKYMQQDTGLIYRKDKHIVGFSSYSSAHDIGSIDVLCVRKDVQRTGIGTALLINMITKLKNQSNTKKITLVATTNVARKCYEKQGFRATFVANGQTCMTLKLG